MKSYFQGRGGGGGVGGGDYSNTKPFKKRSRDESQQQQPPHKFHKNSNKKTNMMVNSKVVTLQLPCKHAGQELHKIPWMLQLLTLSTNDKKNTNTRISSTKESGRAGGGGISDDDNDDDNPPSCTDPPTESSKGSIRLPTDDVDVQALQHLNEELHAFAEYVRLTPTEQRARQAIVDELTQMAQGIPSFVANQKKKPPMTTTTTTATTNTRMKTKNNQCNDPNDDHGVSFRPFGSFAAPVVCTYGSDVDLALWGAVKVFPNPNNNNKHMTNSRNNNNNSNNNVIQLTNVNPTTPVVTWAKDLKRKQERTQKWLDALDSLYVDNEMSPGNIPSTLTIDDQAVTTTTTQEDEEIENDGATQVEEEDVVVILGSSKTSHIPTIGETTTTTTMSQAIQSTISTTATTSTNQVEEMTNKNDVDDDDVVPLFVLDRVGCVTETGIDTKKSSNDDKLMRQAKTPPPQQQQQSLGSTKTYHIPTIGETATSKGQAVQSTISTTATTGTNQVVDLTIKDDVDDDDVVPLFVLDRVGCVTETMIDTEKSFNDDKSVRQVKIPPPAQQQQQQSMDLQPSRSNKDGTSFTVSSSSNSSCTDAELPPAQDGTGNRSTVDAETKTSANAAATNSLDPESTSHNDRDEGDKDALINSQIRPEPSNDDDAGESESDNDSADKLVRATAAAATTTTRRSICNDESSDDDDDDEYLEGLIGGMERGADMDDAYPGEELNQMEVGFFLKNEEDTQLLQQRHQGMISHPPSPAEPLNVRRRDALDALNQLDRKLRRSKLATSVTFIRRA